MTILHKNYSITNLFKFYFLLAILNQPTVLYSLDKPYVDKSVVKAIIKNKGTHIRNWTSSYKLHSLLMLDILKERITNCTRIVNCITFKKQLDKNDHSLIKKLLYNIGLYYQQPSSRMAPDKICSILQSSMLEGYYRLHNMSSRERERDIRDVLGFYFEDSIIITKPLRALYERGIIDFDPKAYILFNYQLSLLEKNSKKMSIFLETVLWRAVCLEDFFNASLDKPFSSNDRPSKPKDDLKDREAKIAMLMPSIKRPLQAKASPIFKNREQALNNQANILPKDIHKIIWEFEGYTIIPINGPSKNYSLSMDNTEQSKELASIHKIILPYISNDLPKKHFIDSLKQDSPLYELVKEHGGVHSTWYLITLATSILSKL